MHSLAESGHSYVNLSHVDTLKLSQHRTWHALGHYQKSLLSSKGESLIDDSNFFISDEGKKDPQAELLATLEAFWGPDNEHRRETRCRYPARYRWLAEMLNVKTSFDDFSHCKRLTAWLSEYEGATVSLIYASAYLENAASMFGHTFLRIDKNRTSKLSPLLSATISFTARTEEKKGPLFALKGLFGFYKGRFGLLPYDIHVKRYGDIDDRDLWEYNLSLSSTEVTRMLMHLWELRHAYFDYYFIDENCSYHLLSLLEASRPELELTRAFRWYAIPIDTVRQVINNQNTLKSVNVRLSKSRKIIARSKLLNAEELTIAKSLFSGELSLEALRESNLPLESQAAVLELVYDSIEYAQRKDATSETQLQTASASILEARSTINAPPTYPEIDASLIRPDLGHSTKRLQVKYGRASSRNFFESGFRLAYHEALDPQRGFLDDSTLEFFRASLRYYPDDGHTSIEELVAVSMLSRPSRNYFVEALSWGTELKSKRRSFSKQERSLVTEINLRSGVSYQALDSLSFSVLGLGALNFNSRFNDSTALGLGVHSLLKWKPSNNWQTLLEAEGRLHEIGSHESTYRFSFSQSLTLEKNLAIILKAVQTQEFGPSHFTATLGVRWYF
jgi:hypothetical protein